MSTKAIFLFQIRAFPLDQAAGHQAMDFSARLGEWRSAAQLLEKTDAAHQLATAVAYYEQVRVQTMASEG